MLGIPRFLEALFIPGTGHLERPPQPRATYRHWPLIRSFWNHRPRMTDMKREGAGEGGWGGDGRVRRNGLKRALLMHPPPPNIHRYLWGKVQRFQPPPGVPYTDAPRLGPELSVLLGPRTNSTRRRGVISVHVQSAIILPFLWYSTPFLWYQYLSMAHAPLPLRQLEHTMPKAEEGRSGRQRHAFARPAADSPIS